VYKRQILSNYLFALYKLKSKQLPVQFAFIRDKFPRGETLINKSAQAFND
jgi:hypothetical protein